jgi:ribonuclease HII
MARRKTDSPLLFDLPLRPDFSFEMRICSAAGGLVAGVDEAGRGPLAGPVVAAAVVLDRNNFPEGLDDSKRLTAAAREQLLDRILDVARYVSVASVSADEIDRTDIRIASLEAMRRAIGALPILPMHVLADGRDIPHGLPCAATALVKGDQRSASIAAASIIAKVTRDRMMERAGAIYTGYGFEKHMGYGTALHRSLLASNGPIARLHRYSFAPIRHAQ